MLLGKLPSSKRPKVLENMQRHYCSHLPASKAVPSRQIILLSTDFSPSLTLNLELPTLLGNGLKIHVLLKESILCLIVRNEQSEYLTVNFLKFVFFNA